MRIPGLILGLVALGALAAAPAASPAQEPEASSAPSAAAAPGETPASDLPAPPAPRPTLRLVSPQPPAPVAPAPPAGRLAAGAPLPAAELEALVDGAVLQAMAADHIPGVAVSVVQNGQVLLKKGYGLASLAPARPVDPDRTLFRIGQISTLFTWIAVMKEVERGRMRLDGPVNLYLPEKLQIHDEGYARPVLVRDLMTHSEGFEDKSMGRLYERDPSRVRALAVYLRQEKPRRVRPAGSMPEYSDYGAALAGEAASQAAGRPFDELVEAEILRPLGMARTTFREPYPASPDLPAPMPTPYASDLAQGFAWTGADYAAQPFEFSSQLGPASSASSSAGDMARLMLLILGSGTLDGAAVYGPPTAQAFRTVALSTGPGIDGWAGGFHQRRLPGGFDGFGEEGGTLSFASDLVTAPALGLGVFVAGDSAGARRLAEQLPALIVSRFYAPPDPRPQGSPDLIANRAAYQGSYVSERRRYGGLEQFVALLGQTARIEVSPQGALLVRQMGAGQAFAPTGAAGQFRQVDGARLAGFQLAGGVAQRWLPPSGLQTYARAGFLQRRRTLLAMAAVALLAAGATLAGVFTRDRRDFRQTPIQSQAGALQAGAAVLWFVAAGAFAVWGLRALNDPSLAYFEWPGPWVMIASSCALVAALCSALQLLLLPGVWRGGRRVDSWTGGRKFAFSVTTLVFLAFSALLGLWGALEPWSA